MICLLDLGQLINNICINYEHFVKIIVFKSTFMHNHYLEELPLMKRLLVLSLLAFVMSAGDINANEPVSDERIFESKISNLKSIFKPVGKFTTKLEVYNKIFYMNLKFAKYQLNQRTFYITWKFFANFGENHEKKTNKSGNSTKKLEYLLI